MIKTNLKTCKLYQNKYTTPHLILFDFFFDSNINRSANPPKEINQNQNRKITTTSECRFGCKQFEIESNPNIRENTIEIGRITRSVMGQIPCSYWKCLLEWENKKINVHHTVHSLDRLSQYKGKISDGLWKGKKYIEMYDCEYDFLKDSKNIRCVLQSGLQEQINKIKNKSSFARVEVGFNKNNKICKISYSIYLNRLVPHIYKKDNHSNIINPLIENRQLFICLGPDGAIRTLYIVPGEKTHNSCGGNVKYLELTEISNLLFCSELL